MKMYKLTKGTLSRIRNDKAGVDELIVQGYRLDGEVDKNYKIVNTSPVFKEEDPLKELKEKAISLGIAPSIVERYKSEETLIKKIAEAEDVKAAEEEKAADEIVGSENKSADTENNSVSENGKAE